ncbi:MAG: RNA-guided endonuclease InsQ/TnpB family protein [Rubrobacteraceae bacterium]
MVKLLPLESQRDALEATLHRVNEACNYASGIAWQTRTFSRYKLQGATYHDIKDRFALTAQVVIRLLAKVADAYKLDKSTKRTFKPLGAIAYDDRILRWYDEEVSIWTVATGEAKPRQRIPYVCDELLATVEVEEPPPGTPEDWLGVDLGVSNIASDSDGEIHTSERVEKSRKRYERIRSKLQAAGTKSAKRHLKKLSGKERRFKRDTNHCLSKSIVSQAKKSDRGIALEDLKGIRQRTGKRLRRSHRGRHGKWAFGELRSFLEYKARLAGVVVVTVDPAYSSQACNECGYSERSNRRRQGEFVCKGCGHVAHADTNAAENIRWRAAVMQRIVSDREGSTHASSHKSRDKPPALAGGS